MVVYPGRGERMAGVAELLTSASGWRGRLGAPRVEGKGGARRSCEKSGQRVDESERR